MKIVMVIQLASILEPNDFGPRFARGHANEYNLVSQDILIVKMGGLCDSRTLSRTIE